MKVIFFRKMNYRDFPTIKVFSIQIFYGKKHYFYASFEIGKHFFELFCNGKVEK